MLPNRDEEIEKKLRKEQSKISERYAKIAKEELDREKTPKLKEEKKRDIDERVEKASSLFFDLVESVDKLKSFLDRANQNLMRCMAVAEAKILDELVDAIDNLDKKVAAVKTVPGKDWDDAMKLEWVKKSLVECQYLKNEIAVITQSIDDKFKKEQAAFHEFDNLSHGGYNSVLLASSDMVMSDAAISKIPIGSILMQLKDDHLTAYWYAGKKSLKIESRSYLMCIGADKNRNVELENLIKNEKISDRDVYVYYFKIGNPNELYYAYIEHGKMMRLQSYDEEVVIEKECGFYLRSTKPDRNASSKFIANKLYLYGLHDDDDNIKLSYIVKDSAGTIHKGEITEGGGKDKLDKDDIASLKGLFENNLLPKTLLNIKTDLHKSEMKAVRALFDFILERDHILEKGDYLSLRGRIDALWEGGQDKPYRMLDVGEVHMLLSNMELVSGTNTLQRMPDFEDIIKNLPEAGGRSTDQNLINKIKGKFDGCSCPNFDDYIVLYAKARNKIKILAWMDKSINSKISRIKEKKNKIKDTKMMDRLDQKLAMLKQLSLILGDVFRYADSNKFQQFVTTIIPAIEKGEIYNYTEKYIDKETGIEKERVRELEIKSKDVPSEVMDAVCWLAKYSLDAEQSKIVNTFTDIYTLSKIAAGSTNSVGSKLHKPLDSAQGLTNKNVAHYFVALCSRLPLLDDKVNRFEERANKVLDSLTSAPIESMLVSSGMDKGKGKEKEDDLDLPDLDLPKKAKSWIKSEVSSPRAGSRKKYTKLAASGSPRSDRTLHDSTSPKQKTEVDVDVDPWLVRSLPMGHSKRKGERGLKGESGLFVQSFDNNIKNEKNKNVASSLPSGNGQRMERKEKAITSKYPKNMPQLNFSKPKVARTTSSKIINSRGIEKTLSSGGLFKGANTLDSSLSRSSKSGKTRRLAENRSTIFMPSTPGAPLDRHRGDRLRLDKKSSTKKLATQISPRNQDSSPKSPKSPKKT